MELKYRLLDHPFYRDWMEGKITQKQLADYSRSYLEFITLVPEYWKRIISGLNVDLEDGKIIVEEEYSHINLWKKWSEQLPSTSNYPRLTELIETMNSLTPSQLLGAIHCFESQQPEVARTKKDGLMEHYGFAESDLTYFDEHIFEDMHIDFGCHVCDNYSKKEEFREGFELASKTLYHSLDLFAA